jgi:hypothetical protein
VGAIEEKFNDGKLDELSDIIESQDLIDEINNTLKNTKSSKPTANSIIEVIAIIKVSADMFILFVCAKSS